MTIKERLLRDYEQALKEKEKTSCALDTTIQSTSVETPNKELEVSTVNQPTKNNK